MECTIYICVYINKPFNINFNINEYKEINLKLKYNFTELENSEWKYRMYNLYVKFSKVRKFHFCQKVDVYK